MTRQVLNRGTIANDGTGDTLRGASLKIEQNFLELYTKFGTGLELTNIQFDSDAFVFEGSSVDNNETRLVADNPTLDRLVRIPNYSGSLVMDSATQTLLNKTLTSPVLTTPQINDTSANHQYVVAVSELTADRTVTLPLLGAADTFTFNNHAAVLKNKTVQSPTINNPIIGGSIRDSASNELIAFTKTVSAVTHLGVTNGITGGPVKLTAIGETNASLSLEGNGTGAVRVDSRLVLGNEALVNASAISTNTPLTIFNNGSAVAHTLPNGIGSQNGELKYLINKGAGTVTVNEVSNNLTAYSSLTIPANASVTLVWLSTQWWVLNHLGATLNA